jgi:predicted ATPase
MRIASIHVQNFKALADFDLDLAKFTCLIGLNGSGKSTVLQVIDFLSQQVRGKVDEWLENRGWVATDLRSKLTAKKNIEFRVRLAVEDSDAPLSWRSTFSPQLLRCSSEVIEMEDSRLEVAEGRYRIERSGEPATPAEIPFTYQGSILSQLRDDVLGTELVAFKRFVESIHSLDMLSPALLRQRTRESQGSLGLGGERLSAFLHELGRRGQERIAARLREVYGQLTQLRTSSLRSGWKQLDVIESYGDHRMTTSARHVNDGLLRLCAVLAELQTSHQLILFDEIENGINPELVDFVVTALLEAPAQVLVTTHSPMILNYLPDEIAREGVIYLYRNQQGQAKSIRFFSIPSMAEKLRVMGPGEVFADTNLVELADEIAGATESA